MLPLITILRLLKKTKQLKNRRKMMRMSQLKKEKKRKRLENSIMNKKGTILFLRRPSSKRRKSNSAFLLIPWDRIDSSLKMKLSLFLIRLNTSKLFGKMLKVKISSKMLSGRSMPMSTTISILNISRLKMILKSKKLLRKQLLMLKMQRLPKVKKT